MKPATKTCSKLVKQNKSKGLLSFAVTFFVLTLKLVSAIFINFLFFHQMIALQKL